MTLFNKESISCALGLVILIATHSSSTTGHASSKAHDDWNFVRHVLLTSEYAEGDQRIGRWIKSPTYWGFVHVDEHKAAAKYAITELNNVLKQTGFKIYLSFDQPEHIDGAISVIPEKDFRGYMKISGCSMRDTGYNGHLCMLTDRTGYFIDHISAVVDEDLSERHLKSVMLEELYQSLGVTNDHGMVQDSINYDDGEVSSMQLGLGKIDKKTLVFLYKYLEPGDDEATVKDKFDKHWSSISVD